MPCLGMIFFDSSACFEVFPVQDSTRRSHFPCHNDSLPFVSRVRLESSASSAVPIRTFRIGASQRPQKLENHRFASLPCLTWHFSTLAMVPSVVPCRTHLRPDVAWVASTGGYYRNTFLQNDEYFLRWSCHDFLPVGCVGSGSGEARRQEGGAFPVVYTQKGRDGALYEGLNCGHGCRLPWKARKRTRGSRKPANPRELLWGMHHTAGRASGNGSQIAVIAQSCLRGS